MFLMCQCVYFLCLKLFFHVYYLNPSLPISLVYPNIKHEFLLIFLLCISQKGVYYLTTHYLH